MGNSAPPFVVRNRASLLGIRIKNGAVSAKTTVLRQIAMRPGPQVPFDGSTATLETGGTGRSEVWFVVRNEGDEIVIPIDPKRAMQARKFVAEYNRYSLSRD